MKIDKYKEAVVCLEQALKQNRKNWKIWENYIILSLETLNFYKAVSATRELMRADQWERLNVTLVLKICDAFLKKFVVTQDLKQEEMKIAKKQLYAFFDEYTAHVTNDWQIWRLIGRIKAIMQESVQEVKEAKLKELRALMEVGWEHQM